MGNNTWLTDCHTGNNMWDLSLRVRKVVHVSQLIILYASFKNVVHVLWLMPITSNWEIMMPREKKQKQNEKETMMLLHIRTTTHWKQFCIVLSFWSIVWLWYLILDIWWEACNQGKKKKIQDHARIRCLIVCH